MGIYQLCYLKMHSGMLFLAGHTEDKEKETLLKALSDVMDAARKAMAGLSLIHISPTFLVSPFPCRAAVN